MAWMFHLGFSGVTVTSDPIDTDEIRDVRWNLVICVDCHCRFPAEPGGIDTSRSRRGPWREVRQRTHVAESVDAAQSSMGNRRQTPRRRVPVWDVVDAVVPRRSTAGRLSTLRRPSTAASSRRPRLAPILRLRGRAHDPPALRPQTHLWRTGSLGGLHVAVVGGVWVFPVRHGEAAVWRRSWHRKTSHRVRTWATRVCAASEIRHRICRHHVPSTWRYQGDLSAERMASNVYGTGSCCKCDSNLFSGARRISRGILLMPTVYCCRWDV